MCRKAWLTAKTAKFNILTAPFDFLFKVSLSSHTGEGDLGDEVKKTERSENGFYSSDFSARVGGEVKYLQLLQLRI
jgi:hypothetical protein